MSFNNSSIITNNLLSFTWIDYTLFCGMFGFSAAIGVYFGCFGSKQSSTKEYLLGGKTMSIFPIAVSLTASNLSGITLLGMPAEIYVYGTQFWACIICSLFVSLVLIYVYLPVFHNLKLNSSYEYFEYRFDKSIRNMASVIFLINTILYIPIVVYIPALAFNQVTGVSIHLITPIVCIICIFYTTLGGLKGVVWTDTLQFSVTMGAMATILILGVIELGSFGLIWEKSAESGRIEFFNLSPDPTERCTLWSIVIGLTFIWISHQGVHQASIQRFLALPSMDAAKKAVWVFAVGVVLTKSISCFTGLIMHAKYFDCDPMSTGKVKKMDQLLPFYVLDIAAKLPGLSGVFVSGVFSTALSTMSTSLNTMAGTIYEDFLLPYNKFGIAKRKGSNVIKVLVIVLGVFCSSLVFIVEKLGGVLQIGNSVHGITGGPILGIFTLGMLFPKANTKGAFYGSLVSFIFVSWMCVGQQVSNVKGSMSGFKKPLYTFGCENTLNETIVTTMSTPELCPEEPFWLYKVSFYWYALIGFALVLIIGNLVSYLTRSEKDALPNKKYLSPIVWPFLSEHYAENETVYYPVPLKVQSDFIQ